jgi:hypothetical protein
MAMEMHHWPESDRFKDIELTPELCNRILNRLARTYASPNGKAKPIEENPVYIEIRRSKVASAKDRTGNIRTAKISQLNHETRLYKRSKQAF